MVNRGVNHLQRTSLVRDVVSSSMTISFLTDMPWPKLQSLQPRRVLVVSITEATEKDKVSMPQLNGSELRTGAMEMLQSMGNPTKAQQHGKPQHKAVHISRRSFQFLELLPLDHFSTRMEAQKHAVKSCTQIMAAPSSIMMQMIWTICALTWLKDS